MRCILFLIIGLVAMYPLDIGICLAFTTHGKVITDAIVTNVVLIEALCYTIGFFLTVQESLK